MGVTINCTDCNSELEAEEHMIGKVLECPNCSASVKVEPRRKPDAKGFIKLFSHYELPGICFQDPGKFLELFGHVEANVIANEIWRERFQQSCSEPDYAEKNTLEIKHCKYRESFIISFVFPEPQEITESYYLSFIYVTGGSMMCFSLEKGMNIMTKEECMYLVQMSPKGRCNLGAHPLLSFDEYIKVLESYVDAGMEKLKPKKSFFKFWKN